MSDELNQFKTDIALIKQDIKQIERFFNKVDEAVATMNDISKNLAVQESVLRSTEHKVELLEQKLQDHQKLDIETRMLLKEEIEQNRDEWREWNEKKNKEIIDRMEFILESMNNRFNEQEKRIESLENWKWYVVGIAGTISTIIISFFTDISKLFR